MGEVTATLALNDDPIRIECGQAIPILQSAYQLCSVTPLDDDPTDAYWRCLLDIGVVGGQPWLHCSRVELHRDDALRLYAVLGKVLRL